MPLEPVAGSRAATPPVSGRSTPVKTARGEIDKTYRRHALGVERALASFEPSLQEWADYIAFLARLHKSIQSIGHIKELPHAQRVCTRLAQCLNPALPSGVHQKALDIYVQIFDIIGDGLASTLPIYLPGLIQVLSFASLSVRPLYYSLFRDHIFKLDCHVLRPAVKSIILGLLPGIEDETSEDFDEGIALLSALRHKFAPGKSMTSPEGRGYFWQCLFLASITSATQRPGALIYMTHILPRLSAAAPSDVPHTVTTIDENSIALTQEIESVLQPEPGLLIRCFVTGLRDSQILLQRGFLDLLVSHLPLHADVLQHKIQAKDRLMLVSAALNVVLRRDMSLNRRLWSWLLGPETIPSNKSGEDTLTSLIEPGLNGFASHTKYFLLYGKVVLIQCILDMLNRTHVAPASSVQTFRICLSLLDRGEIATLVLADVFIPALRHLHGLVRGGPKEGTDEVVRSASLFFDAVESELIWSLLLQVLSNVFQTASSDADTASHDLDILIFAVTTFNVREEEMLRRHIPNTLLMLMTSLERFQGRHQKRLRRVTNKALQLALILASILPDNVFDSTDELLGRTRDAESLINMIKKRYARTADSFTRAVKIDEALEQVLLDSLLEQIMRAMASEHSDRDLSLLVDIASTLMPKVTVSSSGLCEDGKLHQTCLAALQRIDSTSASHHDHIIVTSIIGLIATSRDTASGLQLFSETWLSDYHEPIVQYLWSIMSSQSPRYHVEAVRLLWQVEALTHTSGAVSSRLTMFLVQRLTNKSMPFEEMNRFAVLWELTMQPQHTTKRDRTTQQSRRPSGTSILPPFAEAELARALKQPLLVVLDRLSHVDEAVVEYVANWINTLLSLDTALFILIDNTERARDQLENRNKAHARLGRRDRSANEAMDEIHAMVRHFRAIMEHATSRVWQLLSTAETTHNTASTSKGICRLASVCLYMLETDEAHSMEAKKSALRLLQTLNNSPQAMDLIELHVETDLLSCLSHTVSKGHEELQPLLLQTLHSSLVLVSKHSLTSYTSKEDLLTRQGALDDRAAQKASSRAAVDPPRELIDCIVRGLSSTTNQQYLGQWVEFMSQCFPLFGNGLLTSMLPLTECLCRQIELTFQALIKCLTHQSASRKNDTTVTALPDLLHGLELLMLNSNLDSTQSDRDFARGDGDEAQFTSAIPGRFTKEGSEGRMSRLNSRLTYVLCLQDSLRSCFAIWSWASNSRNSGKSDATSSASTAHYSLRLKQRTKRMLEIFFFVEGLECLEALMVMFRAAQQGVGHHDTAAIMNLLHTLRGSRPREVLPIVLAALYSRTNAEALDTDRRSTLTCDLSSLDIAIFLLEYISTVEDDAMDEIWTTIMTFLRDVLSNPLPYRLILPALLEVTALVAGKIDNTNFGEQRKMLRELGDVLMRLLTATFTARPQEHAMPKASSSQPASEGRGYDLLDSLVSVAPSLTVMLEGVDRVSTAVNAITTNVISHAFHAKAFPKNLTPAHLKLAYSLAVQCPTAKSWKKEVGDAFADVRFLSCGHDLVHDHWYPLLRKWCLDDKEHMPDLITRLVAPTTAGIMFGVGGSAARLDADRKTQMTLRRIALLLLACDIDLFISILKLLEDKLTDLLSADPASSPSSNTRADIFMVLQAMMLRNTSTHVLGMWPLVNSSLRRTLSTILPEMATEGQSDNNMSLLQASKLLDLLVTLGPDDFQLHEWLYLADTVDAVYRPVELDPTALADNIAESLANVSVEADHAQQDMSTTGTKAGRPLLSSLQISGGDIKAMARDDFVKTVLSPFYGHLSMHAYEANYNMIAPDLEACSRSLLKDLLDEATIA